MYIEFSGKEMGFQGPVKYLYNLLYLEPILEAQLVCI